MRITDAASYQNLLTNLQGIEQRMNTAETQVSTGNRINQPSDDPAGSADLVQLTGEQSEMSLYMSNAQSAQNQLSYTDTVLSGVQSTVQQAITTGELALSNSQSAAEDVTQINSLRDQVLSAANTAYQGTFLFGGTVTNTQPYVEQSDGSVSYQGNSSAPQVQIGRATTLQTQIPGSQVFSGSVNVFDSLQQLSSAINSGDTSAIQAQVNNLQQYYNSISAVRAQVGSLTNSAQDTQTDITAYQTALTTDQSRVQSADMAQAATNLTQTQNALQAALEAGARISQVSLLDYIN